MKKKMLELLQQLRTSLDLMDDDSFNFFCEAAIYWFANDYHTGQWSQLYSILSTSDYNPSRSTGNIYEEDEIVIMMYQFLEEHKYSFA